MVYDHNGKWIEPKPTHKFGKLNGCENTKLIKCDAEVDGGKRETKTNRGYDREISEPQ